LFVEQSFNLLRSGGLCGIVVPSGIYTDLGATGLRDLLFAETKIDNLFSLSNERFIFEGIDHRFKFCLLTFEKGKTTQNFYSAFRINPREAITTEKLSNFLHDRRGHLKLFVDLIKKLSPDSRSVMEFKSALDVQIAEKMLQFPLLGEQLDGVWNLKLTNEFHMTNDSHLFKTEAGAGRLPLYEGKMIHQFTHRWGEPRYWVDENQGNECLQTQRNNIGKYKFVFRKVSSNTNERTLIATCMPSCWFTGESLTISLLPTKAEEVIFIVALFNSYVLDFFARNKVTTNCSMYLIYQLPVPRLTATDAIFNEIVQRAAQLVCTSAEFDDLRAELTQSGFKNLTGVTDLEQRAQLRAELDAMIARLYGLTAVEFEHVLNTFPLVSDEVKSQCKQEFAKR
jgi:hypothetical protein